MAEKEAKVEVEGEVLEFFRVRHVPDRGSTTGTRPLGYTSGKMRRYRIRINPRATAWRVELSPYDLERGRIVYRER